MARSNIGLNAEQITEWLKVLVAPASTGEMRVVFGDGTADAQHYESTDLLRMAQDAVRVGKDAKTKGIYWLMNPLPVEWCGSPAKDTDIVRRRWLLIDCDPKREGTVSSTDAEKDAVRQTMVAVDQYLAERGWPAPVIADSGNGFHLLYRIDLPGDDAGLVHRCLKMLAKRFDDGAVSIDQKVANASRICKLYGTVSRKGKLTAERPHRVSTILTIPEQLDVVPATMLEKLVSENGGEPSPVTTGEPVPPPSATDGVSYPDAIERARKYLEKCDPSIDGQHGHHRLLRAASVLINDFRLTDGEAFDLLLNDFNPRCEPRWKEHDIRRKIAESKRNPPNRPAKGARTGSSAASSPAVDQRDETTNLTVESWPEPIDPTAFHGVAGDIVRKIDPHSEADPIAVLIQTLVAAGNVMGRHAYFRIEATHHFGNLFGVLVGSSSTGRKETSGHQVCRVIRQADEEWFANRVTSGLVSGEGLTWQVRDRIVKEEAVHEGGRKNGKVIDYQDVIEDSGVADKRLLVFETEFSSVMKCKSRDGNTLSETMRQAWDSGRLRTAAKNSPAKATDTHVSIIGHITDAELRKVASQTDMTNGLANRFLWCCVRRSKLLPDGGQGHQVDFGPEIAKLKRAVEFASVEREVCRDASSANEWRRLYPSLTAERPGAVGAICNRGAAQVVRLSLLYALLDCSPLVTVDHLHAALALWNYCEASVKYIFGNSLTNQTADAILNALKGAGETGVSRTAISDLFKRNRAKLELDAALQVLYSAKLARREVIPTNGRSVETWFATA